MRASSGLCLCIFGTSTIDRVRYEREGIVGNHRRWKTRCGVVVGRSIGGVGFGGATGVRGAKIRRVPGLD